MLCLICLLILPVLCVHADDEKHFLQFQGIHLLDLLDMYSRVTGRKVWMEVSFFPSITIMLNDQFSKEEWARIMRTKLLESYAIDLRDVGEKESFASWSDDPKYRELRAAGENAKFQRSPPKDTGKPRVRVIER